MGRYRIPQLFAVEFKIAGEHQKLPDKIGWWMMLNLNLNSL
jgi:hypothetical protein